MIHGRHGRFLQQRRWINSFRRERENCKDEAGLNMWMFICKDSVFINTKSISTCMKRHHLEDTIKEKRAKVEGHTPNGSGRPNQELKNSRTSLILTQSVSLLLISYPSLFGACIRLCKVGSLSLSSSGLRSNAVRLILFSFFFLFFWRWSV